MDSNFVLSNLVQFVVDLHARKCGFRRHEFAQFFMLDVTSKSHETRKCEMLGVMCLSIKPK